MIDLSESTIASEEWGIVDSTVYFTEVQLEDGSLVSFFEPESEAVGMYDAINIANIIAVVVTSPDGIHELIRPEDEKFKPYKVMLLKEKRAVQYVKLTDLNLLLMDSILLGDYDVVLLNDDKTTFPMRSIKLYDNDDFNLMLSTSNRGGSHFRVDSESDMVFDHYYESESDVLDIKSFITADPLEQFLYENIMDMINKGKMKREIDYQGFSYLITFNE